MLRVLPSLKFPIATNAWLVFFAILTVSPNVMELRLAALTVTVVVALVVPEAAET
jgi:hypothetical protein